MLHEGAIKVQCPQCNRTTRVVDKATCDWPFLIKGGPYDVINSCVGTPSYVLPYKSFNGVKFRCVCKEHTGERHIIPFRYIGPRETAQAIQKEFEKVHPVGLSVCKTYIIFGAICGPLLIGYAFLCYAFPKIPALPITAMTLFFGFVWYVGSKSKIISVPPQSHTKLKTIWIFVILTSLLVEILLH